MDPLGVCKAASLRGKKTFSSFQKGLSSLVFLKAPEPFPKPIKNKLKTIGPQRSLRSSLPPGDKTFSSFQKGLSSLVFLKPQTPFTTPILVTPPQLGQVRTKLNFIVPKELWVNVVKGGVTGGTVRLLPLRVK